MDYLKKEIADQEEYKADAIRELAGLKELAEAFENFSIGFAKIGRSVKALYPTAQRRIDMHQERINELRTEADEVSQ